MSFFEQVVSDSLGAMLIGMLISVPLWGVTCAQVWHYYQNYPLDSKGLKLLVAVVFALDTFHQCLISHGLYVYTVTHFADPLFLIQTTVWSVLLQIPVQAIVGALVQMFFAYRILKLSGGSYPLFGLVMALSLAETGVMLGVTIQVYRTPGDWIARAQSIRVLEPTACALGCAVDMIIAGVLILLLGKGKSHYQQTNSVIAKLMSIILSTGLVTTCCAIIMMITYFVLPNALVYLSCYFILGRLYTNSFLVQLNMRYSMRQQLSAGPRVITTSIPPKHPLLNQQPTQSNSQSHSQSQSSTQAHSNFKSSANTHATSQPSSLTYSHPYAHPVYAPEHYKADVYRRARKEEEAGITFSDDNHLSLRDPERTFTSNSNMFELAPMPEIETVRPLPAPSHPTAQKLYA